MPIEGPDGRRATAGDWTPEWSLEAMDRCGVDVAVLSLPAAFNDDAGEVDPGAVRRINEHVAAVVASHPDRFRMLAALPMPDVDASLREVEHGLDALAAAGIGLHTSYAGRWLGDPAFGQLFEELERRAALVFIHPTVAPRFRNAMPGVGDAFLEYPFDTTRTVVSLLLSGRLQHLRSARLVLSHFGGALPALAERVARIRSRAPGGWAELAPAGVEAELGRLYYDTASNASPAALAAVLAVADPGQLVLGTDAPFLGMEATLAGLRDAPLSAPDRVGIEGGHAARLLGLETG